jgi:hypothetical protein
MVIESVQEPGETDSMLIPSHWLKASFWNILFIISFGFIFLSPTLSKAEGDKV